MESLLKPNRFDTLPNVINSDKQWLHWHKTFENFISAVKDIKQEDEKGKLSLLVNYISPNIYEFITDCSTYDAAINTLKSLYVKEKNEIFLRYKLASRHQHEGESIDEYMQALVTLGKDCSFKAVTAQENRDDYTRDSFINGLRSTVIRQRLLENKILKLEDALNQARSLEMAEEHSKAYITVPNATSSFNAAFDTGNIKGLQT